VAEILLLCGNYLIKDVHCCLQDNALIEPRAKAEIWTERLLRFLSVQFWTFNVVTAISTSDKQPGVGLALAADGKSILCAETELEDSNIMLVKNFR
jgi:hypothetical protein